MITTKLQNFLLISIFLIMSNLINAQPAAASRPDDRNIRVGFKIVPGYNWVKTKTTNVQRNGSNIGFGFGFMLDKKIHDNYYLAMEVNVSTMTNALKLRDSASHVINDGTNRNYSGINYKYKVQYIELPVSFKFRTKEIDGLRFWGQFGLAPGFLISNNVTTNAKELGNGKEFPSDEKYNPNQKDNNNLDFVSHKDNFSVFRAAMIIGAGAEYRLSGNTSLYGGLRFNNGFTDILRDNRATAVNNVLGLEIGIYF